MHRSTFRFAALVGLAFLGSIPNAIISAASLREEAVAYRTQGYEAQRRGDRASAKSFYQKAIELDSTYPTPHNDVGVLLEEEGRLEEAERSYKDALSLNPNHPEANANLAMLYERLGQKEKAIAHWTKRYQLGDPADPWTDRAQQRLVALGALKQAVPGLNDASATRRRLMTEEFQAHAQSVEEFRAVTEAHGDWP
ncbi:MAG: tetratricopeptide repeat protein [Candidatus Omnitrophica bacterium]|nr:tetratricopeptide repeat protein [Candidatus Omnitrophota bacterium]MBI3020483.1 tetratricopeptide repeat protein [Candidatus Omnitrophota bacterium]